MQVFVERENKKQTIQFAGTVDELLKKMNINSETVLVVRNDVLLTSDFELNDTDSIQLLSVISGG